MTALILSLAMLVLGPAIIAICGRNRHVIAGIDTFVLISIAGLVLFHLIPESFAVAGWSAGIAVVIGAVVPWALHKWSHHKKGHDLGALLPVAMIGLMAHAFIDGIALSEKLGAHQGHTDFLALGVILHRLPMAMAVWWIVSPRSGKRAAIITLSIIGVASVAGFNAAELALPLQPEAVLGWLQALVAGSLMHVVHAHSPAHHSHCQHAGPLAIGSVIAGGALIGLSLVHPVSEHFSALGGLGIGLELAAVVGLVVVLFFRQRKHVVVFNHRHQH
ncbi:MAG: hypothetical protein AUK47_25985 [Deltaproteobacteria bacterium CG2_30_63_29]|nr:MAG: hypothetical protein AUK47_25985 [Deltaproteobacteria bacterium CG2_30_63_29]PIV98200.1 MAG: hypothetical protein COW42_16080 [Deltaproteobacteria bacterium CG17_big_fil_post_rev_8_21_14_2_50_63_7]PJB37323.1 MAG: hypothetical protein CO108_21420 [Deltaproteobacteria bacterium CG_4_9_14_3_um_filter_63_12]